MTKQGYALLLEQQGHRCKLCLKPESEIVTRNKSKLEVDHDPVTGYVRGLLCGACNSSLGKFRDDPATLRRAADYVENPDIFRVNGEILMYRGLGWSRKGVSP